MSETREIKCDGCDRTDINYTGNCEGWFLQLANVSCSPWFVKEGLRGGAVTSMLSSPPIKHNLHFCGVGCLAKWMADNEPQALASFEKMIKHRAWLAERSAQRS